ncbi:hypothetical protein [Sphingobacterium sp.]|uniref:hypothetical protein n=1 Tax=Sphingobacterium sp. TaxID=341027 RepID=UPI0031D0E083
MENRINKEVLEVPVDFRIACEAFGIKVADFLQLLIDHFAFVNLFAEEDSVYNLVARGFAEVDNVLGNIGGYKTEYSQMHNADQSFPLYKQLFKLAMNRNYSWNMKRNLAKKTVDKLFLILNKDVKMKPTIYLDENTPIRLSRDFRIWSIIHNCPAIPVLNAMMLKVSLADLYARDHLDEIEYNPILGMYLRVQGGYGNLVDAEHINGLGFKDFLCDLQEFKMRYFLFYRLSDRIEIYRERFLENYNEMNKTNIQ